MQPVSEESDGAVANSHGAQVSSERSQMWSVARRASAGVVVLAAAVVLALNRPVAKTAFIILLFSVSLAYLIAPVAMRLQHYRRGRPPMSPALAALIVYLVLFIIGVTTWMLIAARFQRQLADLRLQIPAYTERARHRLESVERFVDYFAPPEPYAEEIRTISRAVSELIKSRAMLVGADVIASLPFLPWFWLVPGIALLLIGCSTWFRDSAVAHLPEGHLRWRGAEFFRHVNSILAGYTRAQMLSCLLVGVVSIAGFSLIGISHALLLGTAAGVLEFLPAVGPLSLAVTACSIVRDDRLFLLVIFLIALRVVQDYLIYPLLVGHEMHLHPLAVVLAVVAGVQTGGLLGILAAIPAVGIASAAVRHWREYWLLEKVVREHERKPNGGGPAKESSPGESGSAIGADATSYPTSNQSQGQDSSRSG